MSRLYPTCPLFRYNNNFVSFQCLFLIYCMSPLNGSTFIYSKFIVPVFYKNRSAIDDILNKGSNTIGKFTDEAIEKGLFL